MKLLPVWSVLSFMSGLPYRSGSQSSGFLPEVHPNAKYAGHPLFSERNNHFLYTKWHAKDKEFALRDMLHGERKVRNRPGRIQGGEVPETKDRVYSFYAGLPANTLEGGAIHEKPGNLRVFREAF